VTVEDYWAILKTWGYTRRSVISAMTCLAEDGMGNIISVPNPAGFEADEREALIAGLRLTLLGDPRTCN
jgi:hypothetical protein